MEIDRTLDEYISLYTERPLDVIREASEFMSNIALRSKYIIFQSNFGFCDNDVPFTCIVQYNESKELYEIEFWNMDWCSFNIEAPRASDKIATVWELNCPSVKEGIPNWKELTAKEIVNHDEFVDKRCYAEDYTSKKETLQKALYEILTRYYNPEEPFGFNPKTSGLVAVLYRESIEYDEDIDINHIDTTLCYETDEESVARCEGCKHIILSSLPEADEFDVPYCPIHGYPCDMIKTCNDYEYSKPITEEDRKTIKELANDILSKLGEN